MRWIAPIALVCGLGALGTSVWNCHQAETRARQAAEHAEARAKLAAEAAFRRHEEATVGKYGPVLAKIAEDFGVQRPLPPRSVADILVLLVKLFEGISR